MSVASPSHLVKAIVFLTCSAFLFSVMGVCIRFASHTVDNATVVFFRNFVGLFIFLPLIFNKGISFFKTEKLWMHTWRSVAGLTAMYGFFYAIAHLKLSNAMVFTYSSPIFIPLIAWLFLKEKVTQSMLLAAAIGFIGVLCVAKPDSGLFNLMSVIGLSASFLAAMAFVTVRALTQTEPPERIVFYFCLIGTLISMIPMFWHWRPYTLTELGYLIAAGLLANTSQLFLSNAYKLAPAGQIGPVNYIAIFFAGLWGYLFWQEVPDLYSLLGLGLIFCGILLCSPVLQNKLSCVKTIIKKAPEGTFLICLNY
jgi:Permeases of the drug/metabolite transporter (DMT) superfamily